MRFTDLLKMSFSSLIKRKVRTVLTILGVVVGTASIIVMISIGLGLQKTTEDTLSSSFSLTNVTVSDYNKENVGAFHLTESGVKQIAQMEHVVDVTPIMSLSVWVLCGQYRTSMYLMCVPAEKIESYASHNGKSTLAEGEFPKSNEGVKIVVGSHEKERFVNKAGRSFYETGVMPQFDYMRDSFQIVYDMANFNIDTKTTIVEASSNNGSNDEKKIVAKKYPLKFAGVLEDNYSNYASIDDVVAILKKVYKNRVIPGQPTQKNGKPYNEIFYDEVNVQVDDMENVMLVMDKIKEEFSLPAYSNTEYLMQMQEQNRSVQNMLGAIGLVSLVVAAIGIANTMMMSIYERTKEIGVMKVLGCTLSDIRTLFLLEAGYIGFIGGVVGIIVSYGISFVLNNFAVNLGLGSNELQYFAEEVERTTSYIPPYLSVVALVFAVIVGVLAGLLPAIRAMRLSPLAAIRNE